MKRQNMAALYLRLSRDDGGDSESNSIQTQRLILQKFAKDNRLAVYSEYIDDGVSGTTFERSSFKKMVKDIEGGKISTVMSHKINLLKNKGKKPKPSDTLIIP
ncbi:MAG: recombinase family protein [Oscillospiraceae bacterium]|nr:recombinase family protein [Oscillospiraceae bacterium]